MPDLNDYIPTLLALSAASERLVVLIKGRYAWLNDPKTGDSERWRKFCLRVIAIASGILTAALASPYVFPDDSASEKKLWLEIVGLGILAAGGSDLWNSILGSVNGMKDHITKKNITKKKSSINRRRPKR